MKCADRPGPGRTSGGIFPTSRHEWVTYGRALRDWALRRDGRLRLAFLRERYPKWAGMTRKPVIEVRRSKRRRRTVSAYRDGERVVVLIPAQFSRAEEREWVDRMLERLAVREQRARRTDMNLSARAQRLTARYLPDHPAASHPASV